MDSQSEKNGEPMSESQGGPPNSRHPQGFYYHHHSPGILGLSVEEIKVIRECSNDANWKFAMPAAAMAAILTYFASRRTLVSPAVRSWTTFWTVSVAAVFGNFAGRLAYTTFGNCQDKMAALPQHSHIGETARKLNAAGVRLPPYLIVAGAEWGPWSGWQGNPWQSSGFASGYRFGEQPQMGFSPKSVTFDANNSNSTDNRKI
jgi:Ovarian carcinoma immunoreactive antigen (OCIA)